MNSLTIEVCLDSVESARAAEQGGAQRVELCDNLVEGGTTPSLGMIETTRAAIRIGLQVMIRPRGGDFLYSPDEFAVMKRDVTAAKAAGADGVVFGLLNADGTIDRARTAELIAVARPMNVTFHRAFDMTRDAFGALETLTELGVNRVLTSGQEPSVLEGASLISELVRRARDRIIVMPGCGITPRNLARILEICHPKEIHVVGNRWRESEMTFRHANCFMGTELRSPEYGRPETDATTIAQFCSGTSQGR